MIATQSTFGEQTRKTEECCFVFEFGLPPYRRFLIEAIAKSANVTRILTGTDRFVGWKGSTEKRLPLVLGRQDNRLYWLNPLLLRDAGIIFSTFNLRRPHTWMWIFLYRRKKWVFWGQGRWTGQGCLTSWLRRKVLNLSHGYIVYTKKGANDLVRWGYPQEKIRIAYNTLAIPNSGWTDGDSYYLYLGRVQKRKRIEILIHALTRTTARLRIVGDGEHTHALQSLAKTLGVASRIDFFPGTFDDNELKAHFSGAIAYTSPAQIGLGVVHAFAYALPVIIIPNLKHGPEVEYCNLDNSYFCDGPAELREKLRTIDAKSDQHQLKKREAIKTYQRKLSPERMIRAFDFFKNSYSEPLEDEPKQLEQSHAAPQKRNMDSTPGYI